LRMKIKELAIMHQGRSMGMLTVSIGVAVFPDHGVSPKELMAAADAALYEAKRRGRDQVVVASLRSDEDVAAPGVALPEAHKSMAGWS
jgi:diguanylate cyclase (GGDEF)-like protein